MENKKKNIHITFAQFRWLWKHEMFASEGNTKSKRKKETELSPHSQDSCRKTISPPLNHIHIGLFESKIAHSNANE